MAKPIKVVINLQADAGRATPAPPLGPTLGQHGVPIQDFCTRFNDMTKDMMGYKVRCKLTVFEDRTFNIELMGIPVVDLIKKAVGLKKGSSNPNTVKVGQITWAQVEEIAKQKMEYLNTKNLESAKKVVAGSAKSLGLRVVD